MLLLFYFLVFEFTGIIFVFVMWYRISFFEFFFLKIYLYRKVVIGDFLDMRFR